MIAWLLSNALVAAGLALLALLLIKLFKPSPAVRHTLWLLVLLKLVSPSGWLVTVPLPVTTPTAEPVTVCPAALPVEANEHTIITEVILVQLDTSTLATANTDVLLPSAVLDGGCDDLEAAPVVPCKPSSASLTATPPRDWTLPLFALWGIGAVIIGWRQLRDTRRFARFVRQSLHAPDELVSEVAVVANQMRVRVPTVRVLRGLSSPVMWCLWQPILLWPAGLDSRLKGAGRRAVLAHELAHLRRRDHWVRRIEMLAAVLHWWNPLFWLARRRLRADAEFACDAWATDLADRRAYAEALLEVCSFHPRHRPAPAVGVIGEGRRTMQERLTMIMNEGQPKRLTMTVKLLVALMAVAAVPAWTLGQSAPVKITKEFKAETTADPEVKALEEQLAQLGEKLKALRAAKQAQATKNVEIKNVLIERPLVGTPTDVLLLASADGVKVVGADGKEVKDVRVVVVDPSLPAGQQPKAGVIKGVGPASGTVNIVGTAPATPGQQRVITARVMGTSTDTVALTRSTYKLTKEQVAALSTLLGSVKGTVMETKVEGDSITITTTPEAQATIASLVRMVKGQAASGSTGAGSGGSRSGGGASSGGSESSGGGSGLAGTGGAAVGDKPGKTPDVKPLPPQPKPPAVPLPPKPPEGGLKAPAVPNIPNIDLKQLDAEKLAEQLKMLIELKLKGDKEKSKEEKK